MIAANSEPPEDDEGSGGMGALLTNPRHTTSDIKLVARAIRRRWPVKSKQAIVGRLIEIVEKRSVAIPTKDGVEEADGPADKNAIAAAKVLVSMESSNQADDHHAEGETVKHEHSVIIDQRRDRLASLASRFGAAGTGGMAIDVTSTPAEGNH